MVHNYPVITVVTGNNDVITEIIMRYFGITTDITL